MTVAFARTVQGTSSASTSSGSIDLSGCIAGETALVLLSRQTTANPSSTPSGWTLLRKATHVTNRTFHFYWKQLASGDLGTLTWTFPDTNKLLLTAAVYSGVSSDTPTFTSPASDSAVQTVDFGSLSTSEPWIAAIGGLYTTSAASYDVSGQGLTERADTGDTSSDFWHYWGDTNGGHAGGSFAPSATTAYVSVAGTTQGMLVVLKDAAAPEARPMTPNRGIW